MKTNMLVIFLVAVILSLSLSLLNQYYSNEQAFTPNNLIKIELVSR